MSEKFKIIIILAFFGLVYSSISLVNHYTFKTYAWDLGIKNNELYDYAHFKWNHNTLIYPAPDNKLGNHFSLYLFFVSPFYWIFGSWTLLIFQIIMILFGGFGVYKFFKRKCNKGSPLPIYSMIFFFSLWGIYSALGFDYHDNVVAAMFLPWLMYAWDEKKSLLFVTFSVLMIIGKENISIWLLFIGIALLFLSGGDRWKKKAGISLSIISLLYLILTMFFLIPALAGDIGYRHFRYSTLGEDIPSAIKTIFTQPFYAISLLWQDRMGETQAIKVELHFFILVSGGIFLLLRPAYIIMLIPLYAQKLLNDSPGKWGIDYHYSIEFVPVLALATFSFLAENKKLKNKQLIAVLSIFLAGYSSFKSLGEHALYYHQKQNYQFLSKEHYQSSLNYFKVKKTLRSIPETASVCAQNTLVPHLAFRDTIHVFDLKYKTTDYIVLADQRISVFPSSDHDYFAKINYLMNSGKYEITREENGITIFRKIKDSPAIQGIYMDTVSLQSWPSGRLEKNEFIGFGNYRFEKGDFFRAEILLNEPSDELILIAKSIINESVEFDTRSIIEEKNTFKMIVEGGPAFNKQSDTLNFFIWNRDEKLVSVSKFTLLERKYKQGE